MTKTLLPRSLHGSVSAISSKSHIHRLMICAALSEKPTQIRCSGISRDIRATVNCLSAMGASVRQTKAGFEILPIRPQSGCLLPCGESGSTLRFLLPVAAALGMDAVFEMEGRLPQRPLAALEDQLQSHGITLSRPQPHLLRCSGQLQPGDYTLPGHISSQFISGLLLALPLLDKVSTLTVTGQVESAPYIQLTLDTLRQFGICIEAHDHRYTVHPARFCSPGTVEAEGDWSNAAFWLTAGALGQSVTVSGLNLQSSQGDRIILTLLSQLGASVQQKETSVTVSPGTLRPFTVDVSQIPDLVPILAVAACAAPGVSRITNAGRLRWKESDRLTAICHAINTLGGHAEQTTDSLIIRGGTAFSGGTVDACGDHRIAMAAAIAAILSTGSVTVLGAEAVDKSYPDFWHDFEILQNKTEGALL